MHDEQTCIIVSRDTPEIQVRCMGDAGEMHLVREEDARRADVHHREEEQEGAAALGRDLGGARRPCMQLDEGELLAAEADEQREAADEVEQRLWAMPCTRAMHVPYA